MVSSCLLWVHLIECTIIPDNSIPQASSCLLQLYKNWLLNVAYNWPTVVHILFVSEWNGCFKQWFVLPTCI